MGTRVKKTRRKDRATWKYLNTSSSCPAHEFNRAHLRMLASQKCFLGNSKSYLEKLEDQFGDK